MLISPAFAQSAGGGQGDLLMSLAPLVLIFVVFYFLLIRPQQKRAKDHKTMLTALRRGDKVVTGGGIVGTIARVPNDDEIVVEIAEGVRVRVLRSTISAVLTRGPADAKEEAEKPAKTGAK
ncbi:MAG: preprotein translocase subunit YajC [Alphaproteobacteria bacterium]